MREAGGAEETAFKFAKRDVYADRGEGVNIKGRSEAVSPQRFERITAAKNPAMTAPGLHAENLKGQEILDQTAINLRGRLTPEQRELNQGTFDAVSQAMDINAAHIQDSIGATAARIQGEYELELREAVTDLQREDIQNKYRDRLLKDNSYPVPGGMERMNYVDGLMAIADVENNIWEEGLKLALAKKNMSRDEFNSREKGDQEATALRIEAQQHVDQKVAEIGKAYLGHVVRARGAFSEDTILSDATDLVKPYLPAAERGTTAAESKPPFGPLGEYPVVLDGSPATVGFRGQAGKWFFDVAPHKYAGSEHALLRCQVRGPSGKTIDTSILGSGTGSLRECVEILQRKLQNAPDGVSLSRITADVGTEVMSKNSEDAMARARETLKEETGDKKKKLLERLRSAMVR